MAFQHPLDPYTLAKFFVTSEEREGEVSFELEEGYLAWESLPGGLGLKVGRFHSNFGKLNRFHKHALPWAERDLPTQSLFGEEGLIGNGISLSWLPPKLPIADTNEVHFEIINNSTPLAFSGRGFGDSIYVGHLKNYYDLSDNAYFEWGLSAATSHWDLAARGESPAGRVASAVGLDARRADRGDVGSSSRRRYTADGPTPPQPEGRQGFAATGRRYSSSPMPWHRLLLVPCQQPQIPGARLHATFTTGC